MPTIFTHAVATAAIGTVVLPEKTPVRIWTIGVLCAMAPDLDVISFPLGISYSDMLGHRGVTHSIAFALGLSLLASVFALRDSAFGRMRWRIWLFVFLAVGSHGPLDALTNGGNGIAFFAPFSAERYFFPVTPIAVSPIGLGFVSERGLRVLASEFVWVWTPSLAVAAIGVSLRRRRALH
ncbi:MAG TPA: metal-dependent hydrolase [Burkholderiales bacterium]|nr:metal-dependent hydrolase [Burkholderiales bacterium]